FYPRIEAMSRWDPLQKMARWQVVTSETRPGQHHFQSYGYNNFHPNNNPPNNPYLSSLFPLNDHKSNAVAAGVGRSMGSGIGNVQYTAGYLSWDTNANTQNYMFVRSIDGSTGIATAPYYQVNVNPIPGSPTYAEIDASKGLALSSCSNSGNYILAAWYDGVSEIYEKLTPISNIQFRPTGIADPDSRTTQLYPNPAYSELRLTTSGHYDIYGIDGRQLQSGDAEADHPIHISQLPAGSYILWLQSASETRAFPFVKP
ncbi:MAG: T9SS type A sorting domain-containing protein, partial [Bacteroidetes bacterium]|nr:T9SS type A sorting domain-containing protein [Bacteroidota bacterium]